MKRSQSATGGMRAPSVFRPARVKHVLSWLAMATALHSSGAYAQFRDWLSRNEARNGSTTIEFLAAVERTRSRYAGDLSALRDGVGLVFVPGILGSALKSKSGEEIWGYSLRLSDQLKLPAGLVDPLAESDIRSVIAEGSANGTIDLYGEAMRMIRASAAVAGIPSKRVATCGYDWRRDVRAAARELKACIENSPALQDTQALIVVAHSMGGLVTFQWHRDHTAGGQLASGARVIAIALLGSPLGGSCEVLRMVAKGYVQPTANDRHENDSWVGRFWTDVRTMRDRVVNAVSGFFSDDVRPLILTWPGALDLSVRHAQSKDEPNCGAVPFAPGDDTDPRVRTQYDDVFWTGQPGRSLLAGKALPDTYVDVLPVARGFREGFALEPLASPTYLFASEVWDTPNQPKLVPPTYELDDRGEWHTVDGDGRVPFNAAMPSAIQSRAADALRVYSVHGNLPEDKVFHADFFGQRVPRLLNGWFVLKLAGSATGDEEFLKAYVAAGGRQLHPYDMHGAWERQSEQNQRDPIYQLTRDAWNAAIDFNQALCKVSTCPDYASARRAALNATTAERAAIYSAAIRSPAVSDDEYVFLVAKRGLEMANRLNWVAAIGDLRFAVPLLQQRFERLGAREKEGERQLRINATANLGRALVMRGFCTEAEYYLRSVPADNRWAVDAFRTPCFDRESGKILALTR
jgi:hypothetical protein